MQNKNKLHAKILVHANYSICMTKTHHLNGQKSSLTHRQHIKTHRKKFADLLEESNSPFISPYDSMTAPHFTSPFFHGPLSTTTPKQKTENTLKTVVNLSDAQLSPTELEVLHLGLKFVPTPKQDPTAQLAPLIQNIVKRLTRQPPSLQTTIPNKTRLLTTLPPNNVLL